jgi:hypothetical protein
VGDVRHHPFGDQIVRELGRRPRRKGLVQVLRIGQRASPDRRDVLRDWAEAHREGASVDRLEALADRWLGSSHAIQLEHGDRRDHLGGTRHSAT